jgi:hypothetical protein
MPDGGFLIADTDNHRVRRVWPDGTITTVAGTGTAGFSGDGGPPTAAELHQPKAVAVTAAATILVADSANGRVRLVELPALAPPRIAAARFARTGRVVRAAFRVCDGTRAPLVAELRQTTPASRATSLRRALVSTHGGCRPYRLTWRLPSGRGTMSIRLQVRSDDGLTSNAVAARL